MRKCLRIIVVFLFLFVVKSAVAQTVKVNWQTKAPFSTYHTYAWRMSKDQGSHFYRQWVVKDVNAELAAKGLRKVSSSAKPDLYVYYHVLTQEVINSPVTDDDGYGWGDGDWGEWGGWGGDEGDDEDGGMGDYQIMARPQMMGILSVDLADPNRKELVWRGQATTDSISNSQKGDERQVLKSIQKMFEQYPPKKK